MAFYVPLGPRGLLFRLGLMIIRVSGGLVYWRSFRRRALAPIPVTDGYYPPEL